MPGYAGLNALEADLPVPRFYWTGDTDMRCLAEAIRHTIDHAYAHHIERLMVLGLFCLRAIFGKVRSTLMSNVSRRSPGTRKEMSPRPGSWRS